MLRRDREATRLAHAALDAVGAHYVLPAHEVVLRAFDKRATTVLAAAAGKDGPGPLVSGLAKIAGNFPIPVAIVPGHLSDDEIDASS